MPRLPKTTDDTIDAKVISIDSLKKPDKPKKGKLKSVDMSSHPSNGDDELAIEATPMVLAEDFYDDGIHNYRASSLGNCMAGMVAEALKMHQEPMPASLQPRLDEGTALEPLILAKLHEQHGFRAATLGEIATLIDEEVLDGFDPRYGQVQASAMIGETARVTCHPDEIVTFVEAPAAGVARRFYVVEAKAFGPGYLADWRKDGIKAFDRYAWQHTAQMLSTGLDGIFVVGEKISQDAECELGEISVEFFKYESPPKKFTKLKARVLKAERYAKDEDVPACEDGSWPCGFFKEPFCLGKPPADVEELDDEVLGQLCALLVAYAVDMAKTDEQKQAEKDRKAVAAKIKQHLAENPVTANKKYAVKSPVGEVFEFDWYVGHVDGYDTSYARVKLVETEIF